MTGTQAPITETTRIARATVAPRRALSILCCGEGAFAVGGLGVGPGGSQYQITAY